MKFRTIAVLIGLFAVLIAGAFIWQSRQPSPQTPQNTTPAPTPSKTLEPFEVPTNHEPSEHTDPDPAPGA